jgi:membrane fusion protein, multidrug efflux system
MPTSLTATHHLLALLILATSLAACAPEPAEAPVVPSVYVSPVRNDSGAEQRVLFGSVRPRVEADLSFRVGGKVTARLVELGQAVRKGQVLARIDPADYQLAVEAAIEQQRAAEVDAVQSASDAARFKRLLADGSVGAADAERQQARADAAAARLTQAQKQVDLSRNRAGYAVLTAPFDGMVTALRFETGQMVGEGQTMLSLARPDELEVVVDLPESMLDDLKTWQTSLPTAVGGEAASASAATPVLPLRLRELAPSAHPATRTTRARYALADRSDVTRLRMGMTAEVLLQRPGQVSSAELPLGALLVTATAASAQPTTTNVTDTGTGTAVWLVDAESGALTRQPVRLLSQTTDLVRVSGLPEGALVVTVGAQKLDAGLKVRPVQRPLATLTNQVVAR